MARGGPPHRKGQRPHGKPPLLAATAAAQPVAANQPAQKKQPPTQVTQPVTGNQNAPAAQPVDESEPESEVEVVPPGDTWTKVMKILICITAIVAIFVSAYPVYELLPKPKYESGLSAHPRALSRLSYDPFKWGSYRPQLYFGLQGRDQFAMAFGLIWFQIPEFKSLRHWCDQGEKIVYMWKDHDGETFGHQTIQDGDLSFTTDWFGVGHSVYASVKIKPPVNNGQVRYYFMFYFFNMDDVFLPVIRKGKFAGIKGEAPGYGKFRILINTEGDVTMTETSFRDNALGVLEAHRAYQEMIVNMSGAGLVSNATFKDTDTRNLWYIHFALTAEAKLEFKFVAEGDKLPKTFDEEFNRRQTNFQEDFLEKFELDVNDTVESKYIPTARAALSNLLGGIGYWNGFSQVQSGDAVQKYGPLELVSAVPSRPFFPRGFLWDEGFHNLVIKNFNSRITLVIIGTWLDCMDSDGWIPREMILTHEAAQKVPAEYITQDSHVANPPSIFYLMDSLIRSADLYKEYEGSLNRFYPRLKQWYLWLKSSQQGSRPGTFRWRGRNATTKLELNPKTMASGLDDYPRASHPTFEEYHLDLFCWMALSSRVIRHLAEVTGDLEFMPDIEKDMTLYNSFAHLNKMHWSTKKKSYFDYGRHSQQVVLKSIMRNGVPVTERVDLVGTSVGLVDDVYGYVNLFPFLFRLLPEESEQLKFTLLLIKDHLWTDYGLRSLAKGSAFYWQRNTPHDPPYWRGQIWINMNYMALRALRFYSAQGTYNKMARNLYTKLRQNLLENIHSNYEKTGYFYEHYNDTTGVGGGSHPFTGWTSLVVNMLSEKYD